MKNKQAILGAGTAAFIPNYGLGINATTEDGLKLLFSEAVEKGISYIDAAADYGRCHQVLGEITESLQKRQVRLCTKLNVAALSSRREIGIEESLKALRLESVDTLLLHSARGEDFVSSSALSILLDAKEKKRTRFLGASTYGIEDACDALQQPWCDVVQVEHSILNPSVVRSLKEKKRYGQEIVVRSVLCKGLLTSRRHQGRLEEGAATLDQLEGRAKEWGFSLEELAIRFALDTEGVDVVLVGLNHSDELRTALSAWEHPPLASWQMQELAAFDCSSQDWSHPEKWRIT